MPVRKLAMEFIGTFFLVSIAHSFEFDQINAAASKATTMPFVMGRTP